MKSVFVLAVGAVLLRGPHFEVGKVQEWVIVVVIIVVVFDIGSNQMNFDQVSCFILNLKMVQCQDYSENAEVEGGEQGSIGVVDLRVESFPNSETVQLLLYVLLELDILSCVLDTPLRSLGLGLLFRLPFFPSRRHLFFEHVREVQGNGGIPLKMELYL